ncbi:MAG: hypothetical protein NTY39_04085 [Campylobacterales bacterium]|nr:hypothetical protein [Campylobacterales bacterium]
MSKQFTFSTIISADPYQKNFYVSSLNSLASIDSPSFSKEQYAISFLNTKGFISALIGISKNVPDDDIHDALENKVYEELALDMAVDYTIQYIEAVNHVSESERFFHVFVVDPLTLEQEFTSVIESIKYIDHIIPIPLLLKSLYSKEIIPSSNAHGFIYFQENDAFFTVYNEQEFIYTKSLKYSLKQIHERFCELLGEPVEFNTFKTTLTSQGLHSSNPEYQRALLKLFGEIFLHISDVITYTKRAFEIKQFETIYIGASSGFIAGLEEYAQTYLGLKSQPFDFDYGFKTNGENIDQIHQLMHLYARLESDERYESNFTLFHRPPPFAKRDSGKLILVTVAALVVALLYPGTYWALSYIEAFHYELMNQEYEHVHIEKTTREATVNLKLANKNAAQALLDEQTTAYKQKQESLIQIHDKKENYPMKAKILADFTHSFNQYGVKLISLSYREDNLTSTDENSSLKQYHGPFNDTEHSTNALVPIGKEDFNQSYADLKKLDYYAKEGNLFPKAFTFILSAPKIQSITELLKNLTTTKNDKYNFSLHLVSYDSNSSSYLSELKAVLK